MPLFGSSNNHNNNNNLTATEMDNAGYNNTQATGPGMGRTHEPRLANDPLAPGTGTGTAGMGGAGMGQGANVGGGRHHVPAAAGMHNDGMHNDGMMAGQGQQYGAGGGAAIPPTGALSSQHQQQPHSGGGAMTGKIEHAVGSIVGSKTLKAKGIQKEQEAKGMKIQSQELAEAERLEAEAGLRRERAVGHGAHPDNRHVGGVVPTGPGTYN
ncbi:hypothetical protein B0H17DRAFT_1088420 [Mycena rosella]|uniref:Uncharacterized protein n=1 Tax=Mycena rosella TaxID=1033263 RepID=A0AAD7CX96_MYCRO|nr:hypothetical protein B0H17DRAFT_1088420 [Mycena rosella]